MNETGITWSSLFQYAKDMNKNNYNNSLIMSIKKGNHDYNYTFINKINITALNQNCSYKNRKIVNHKRVFVITALWYVITIIIIVDI